MIRFARWVPGLSVAERGDKVTPGLGTAQFQLYGVFRDAVSDLNDTWRTRLWNGRSRWSWVQGRSSPTVSSDTTPASGQINSNARYMTLFDRPALIPRGLSWERKDKANA
jgi:hypothetical protein